MNDISGKISLYHNLFLVCLVLALICFTVAVVVFFLLDIRTTIGYLTGRRAKKGIKELEAATAVSGRLLTKERSNMQYVAQEMKDDMGVRQPVKPGIRKVDHVVESNASVMEEKNTTLLEENMGTQQEILENPEDTTAVLKAGGYQGRFVIVRELVLIHTEEVI